jgi:hypothetical protein
MYPTTEVELHAQLPPGADFWTPTAEDLEADEGFGYFDNTWPIYDISEAEARELATSDRSLSVVASNLATTELEFDGIATALETGSAEDIEGLRPDQLEAVIPYLTDRVTLEGLELGVAGLVYCLAAAGMYPAASCRGHPGPSAWSRIPVVFLATDRARAELLVPLVRDSGCGFNLGQSRGELLVIESKSIEGTLDLAVALLRELSTFAAASLSARYLPWDYGCWDNKVIWPGERPMFSLDNCDRIVAVISCWDYSP